MELARKYHTRTRSAFRSPMMIYVICCGGRTGTGGMPRMVDYYMTEWEAQDRQPPLRLIDSTGPSYDWRRQRFASIWRQPLFFLFAFGRLTGAGLLGRIATLHIHMADRGSVVRKALFVYLGAMLRRPVVIHMHAATFPEFYTSLPRVGRKWVSQMLRTADRFIVLGSVQRQYFLDTVGLDADRVVIAHNAVPPSTSASPASERQVCQVLFVGTLIARKGLSDLLEALANPRVRALAWHLQIVGEGDQGPWRDAAERHGLADRVDFAGWVSSEGVHSLLDECDFLVLPSLNEGLPMVIIEAMAHARPVIATSVGSVCDAVQDGVTGFVVPPSTPEALAAALERMILDSELRLKFGAAAQEIFDERFTVSRLNRQLEKIFGQLQGMS